MKIKSTLKLFPTRKPLHFNSTHGMTRTPTYRSWQLMKNRCANPKSSDYKYYGGKGVTVCARWQKSFENFLADMGIKPEGKDSIDRINPNGDYTPKNCRWATRTEQCRNRNYNKLSIPKARKMRRLYLAGHSVEQLERIFKCGNTTVRYTLVRRTWAE